MPTQKDFEPFSCEVQAQGALARVMPAGELDLLTTPELQRRLAEVLGTGHKEIVLDLQEVSFLDSTALHLFVRWADASRNDGFNFAIAPGSTQHARLFELTGISGRLRVEEE
jgi:anti-sigma B factor antagonist